MRLLFALLTVLCVLMAPVSAQTAKGLVDEVVKNPGYDDQNCRGPLPPLPRGKLPLFGYTRAWADEKISPQNFLKLRAQRRDVLHEVARQIDAINVEKSASDFNRGEILLQIVIDLNGVEDLSALLRLEKAFDKVAYYRNKKSSRPKAGVVYSPHVQVLSTITAILHNEGAAGVDQLGNTATYDLRYRDLIVRLAENFVRDVDPSNYRRAAAMAAKPEIR